MLHFFPALGSPARVSQRGMAAHRARQWWRRGGHELLLAAAGFGLLFTALFIALGPWIRLAAFDHPSLTTSPTLIDLTLVHNAKQIGAVCLDGSPAGYHFQKGVGSGARSWVIHVEGGGWCNTVASCLKRKYTALGSSNYMGETPFEGILSDDQYQNPDFFNWNKVKIRYCDGASFAGNVKEESQNGTILYFRGQLIWNAVMNELLSKGLADAKQALLTGCSAGGLATLIHCDSFRVLLPKAAIVKCVSDGGFFIDEKDISGKNTMRAFYHDVVYLQDVGKNLQDECTSRKEPSQCFFPREIVKTIKTPLFILNPAYDWWQIEHVLAPDASDPEQLWRKCKKNIHYCDSQQLRILHDFRGKLMEALKDFRKKGGQMFIDACFAHCQTMSGTTGHSANSPRINNKTIADAVANWFFDRERTAHIDCQYPCNPTCHHKESIR